ncbi:MAG: ABC transporter ATP-binding protein [Desulfobacterales bacterium]|nr:ABC transporter ATP-binding protein [Desulfobacterales bacterium]
MNQPIFEINALKHAYAGSTVLEIEHLAVQPASIVGLIGPNGSGKSTLLKLLGLIERPTRGQIYFKGRKVGPFSDDARHAISLLPQEPFLMKRSCFENIAYGLRVRGHGPDTVDRVHEALSLVGLSGKDFARRPWYALSGGETQRVALAARLAVKPEVLLLDEPTAGVDAASAQLIKEAALQALRQQGTTLIVASHDWQWLYEICDKIFHLYRGRISGSGRETIIFGPWRKQAAGKWAKTLSDQQMLYVPAPPDPSAAAVIDGLSVCEDGATLSSEDNVLRGIVSRLSLERKTGRVFATILAGDISFTAMLPPQPNRAHPLFPGKTVYFGYRPDQIKWI